MNTRFENFTISVLRLNRMIQKIKLLEVEEFGLRAIHVMCIYYLDVNREGLTAAELVKTTLEDKAAISRALATLRDSGYITYSAKPYNSKAKLTDAGLEIAHLIGERAARAVDAAGSGLSEDERATLYRSLSVVTERLDAYYEHLASKKEAGQ